MPALAPYTHNLSPLAFTLGPLEVSWYWLSYPLGYLWVFCMALLLIRKNISPLPAHHLPLYSAACWLAVLIGGRLGYVLIYHPSYFIQHPHLIPYIWLGGMSFHGALLACMVTINLLARLRNHSPYLMGDLLALLIPPALALGRIGNFINGELVGKPTSGRIPWGVIFPHTDPQTPRHPSQLYEALLEGALLFIVLWLMRARLQTSPGWITGAFLCGYGILRFFVEFIRLPDPHIGYLIGPFTLGHLLCLIMIFPGLWLMLAPTQRTT